MSETRPRSRRFAPSHSAPRPRRALASGALPRAPRTRATGERSATAQQQFASPDAAAAALVAAVKTRDQAAMLAVLGSDAKPILESGDPVADREVGERFVAGYEEAHAIKASSAGRSELEIGEDEWPFPIPIVKEGAGWRFDTAAGQEEILDRRIGRNERFAIQTCLAFVDAQRDYYSRNPGKDPLLHYARRFGSSEGKRDGLYFPTAEGEEESPLGALVAQARDEGYSRQAHPFHGYHYRMLEAQGPNARDGAYGYVAQRTDDRRLRSRGLPRDLRQLGSDDVHRESGRRRVPEGSRTRYPEARARDRTLRPGRELGARSRTGSGTGAVSAAAE